MITKQKIIDAGFDLSLIAETQPLGNIRFLDNMIQTGDCFMTTLYLYNYPDQPEGFWQSILHEFPNSFVMTDIANQESGEVLKKLNQAIKEQFTRYSEEKEAYDREIALEEYHELNYLAKALRKSEEVMKYVCTRLILFEKTRHDLEKRVAEVRRTLDKNQFGGTVLVMEQEYEYQSLFLDHNSQSHLPNNRIGLDVPSDIAMMTFPANHTFMNDVRGQHLGYSSTGGNIIVDFYELDNLYRKYYNLLILGEMGSGKSTLIKKIMVNLACKGYLLRGFDKSGEYTEVLKRIGGYNIPLDGSSGRINIFQVFPNVLDETTNQVDERASFTQHKGKLSTWYTLIKPEVEASELDIFELMLTDLYESKGFHADMELPDFSSRGVEEYPTLTDFIEIIKKGRSDENNSPLKQQMLEKILMTMEKLKGAYGQLFDGHTSIPNIQTEQIVFFNIDGLMALDQNNIIQAQLFNALNLFWASLINHGKEQARLYKKREITFDEIKRSMLFMDEAHNIINVNNPKAVRFINLVQREGRKMFIGTIVSTQSVSSMYPQNISSATAEAIQDIYNLSQYKIFFKLSSASIPYLQRLAQHDITEGQIERIPRYKQGRCLMNITGGSSIEFDVNVSSRELDLYNGGGRNAED